MRTPSRRKTETRHHPLGKTCFHWYCHGLTCDEYDGLRARAAGHCEVCGIDEGDTRRGALVIDHFEGGRHSFVRGLICDACNGGVMACVDGNKAWDANTRRLERAAREYEANSCQKPSAAALELMAARTDKPPKPPREPRPARDTRRHNVINVPLRRGMPAMAERLREYLTPDQLQALADLLLSESDEG